MLASISQSLPYAGIVCMLVGIIFAIIATTEAPTKKSQGDLMAETKYSVLAYSLIVAGGFMLLGPISNK